MTPITTTVTITPDYESITNTFLNDFAAQSKCLQDFDVETHKIIHTLLASLNVAAAAISSTDGLRKYRDTLDEVVNESLQQLNDKREAQEVKGECTCDFPSALGGHHSYCREFEGDEPANISPICVCGHPEGSHQIDGVACWSCGCEHFKTV